MDHYTEVAMMENKEKQFWPNNINEVLAWLDTSPLEISATGKLSYENHSIQIIYGDEDQLEPWPLQEMAKYWITLQNAEVER